MQEGATRQSEQAGPTNHRSVSSFIAVGEPAQDTTYTRRKLEPSPTKPEDTPPHTYAPTKTEGQRSLVFDAKIIPPSSRDSAVSCPSTTFPIEEEVQRLMEENTTLNKQINLQAKTITRQEEKLRNLKKKEAKITELEKKVQEKETGITELENTAQTQEAKIQELEDTAQTQEATIQDLEGIIQTQAEELGTKEGPNPPLTEAQENEIERMNPVLLFLTLFSYDKNKPYATFSERIAHLKLFYQYTGLYILLDSLMLICTGYVLDLIKQKQIGRAHV